LIGNPKPAASAYKEASKIETHTDCYKYSCNLTKKTGVIKPWTPH